MKKKLILTTLTGTLLLGAIAWAPQASADNYDSAIQENLNRIQETENKVHSLDETLESLEVEVKNTEVELSAVNDDITANENKINEVVQLLEETHAEMTLLIEEIAKLEENIERRTEQLENQARTVQVDGQTANYVEFIINAESLTDIFGRIDVVTNLVKSNRHLIQSQVKDKESVTEKQERTEETIDEQNAFAAELEMMSEDLEQQRLEKEVLVAQLAAERSTAQAERNRFLSQKAEAEQAVVQLVSAREEAQQAAREAAERRRVEERAQAESSAEESEVAVSSSPRDTSVPESSEETSTPSSGSSNTQTPPSNNKPAAKPTPAPSSGGTDWSSIASYANSVLGVRYVYGGTTTAGFDCSGFTSYVFNKIGKSLPRSAAGQYAGAQKVSNPKPGDLVFFSAGGGRVTHVGIYTGGGQFIGSQTSTGVAYTGVHNSYWGPRLVGYGRY